MRVDTPFSMRCLVGCLLLACGPSTEHAVPVVAEHAVSVGAEHAVPGTTPQAAGAGAAPAAKNVETLAQVREDVPLALPKLLGHTVAEVEAQLGASLGKGMDRKTCVRFVPERVFFTCDYALRPYADKTGTFEEVIVAFEDGRAGEMTFDGLKAGSGPFDPQVMLDAIGLTLPEPGNFTKPVETVRVWTWFNPRARLRIAGKEHRVEVSIVQEDWSRARVTIYENDRLTPEQTAKIVQPASREKVREPAPASP